MVVPPSPSTSLTISLHPSKDAAVMLMIKALVGSKTSGAYQVGFNVCFATPPPPSLHRSMPYMARNSPFPSSGGEARKGLLHGWGQLRVYVKGIAL